LSEIATIAASVSLKPSLAPLPDGGIDIEWASAGGDELLVEVPPKGGALNYALSKRTATGGFVDKYGRLDSTESLADLICSMA
jgi:hypothetical protein